MATHLIQGTNRRGKERKTKRICALPPDTTEEAARAHFSTLGLSAENPLGRGSNTLCRCWNLCYPVFADDLSRASGGRRMHKRNKAEGGNSRHCGMFDPV